ncbi:putative Type IV pilus-associated protein [Pseudomonas syringae pv. philadelphi]|uniref:Putative Type IV pilus-associated protein n=1 Tax=Pseudomonas syringae pv. philadelphi TaxID=251706 RepID=A0A3M3YMM1_9PSED|nr:PilC/PilY family type IV pilus protein [Pseudomonas syringae group genomosp. 3]RMO83800.1 putative Type IV pilus-associated protein [Pseudomonas syringae pv. philadelphi]
MPTVKGLRGALKYLYGAVLVLYLTTPVYAFTPAQVPLLSASAVPPNLMLMVDNSGSMYNIIWATGFDPTVANRPSIIYAQPASCGFFNCRGVSIQGDDTLSLDSAGPYTCNNNYTYIARDNVGYCLKLPDPAGDANESATRYTADYLSYLIDLTRAANTNVKDFTLNNIIPNDYRINVARNVSLKLVENNKSLRIGLAGFNPPTNADPGRGGKISREITDLSPVASNPYNNGGVSQTQANTNTDALNNAIKALRGDSNTPLAETYYEITRYFRGMTPYYGYTGAPTTYTSPIQYRCQKNFGVVITDGLPTYDRTFPTNDPEDVLNTSRSLPNWDLNAANDGANLNGDGEGDTLYLDDIAKFAYDIDMRRATSTPATDLTKKSWDTDGFVQQNMSTYTIGFTAANQMLIDAADNDHGHGKYFQTNDSAGLNSALNLALSDIYAKAGSGGGGASNSSTLQAGTLFFQTLYDPSDWHGTINAFQLDATTGATGALAWTSDTTILASSTPVPTYESWNTLSSATIALNFTALSPAQQTAFTATLPTGVNGSQMIAWAKGTANAALRTRTRVLGDLINTNLVVTSASDKTSTDYGTSTSYSDYLTTKASKMNSSLLANANDGFFNVITPGTGKRTYAYMPSTAVNSLATVAATNYGAGTHKFTVDGQITVFDTQTGPSATWRTVAASGLGAGGKAFFAIRLFEGTTNNVGALWEVKAPDTSDTNNKFNNLGYTYSRPEAARMDDGTGIVVVGNGYGSFTGRASLFVLNASTGALIAEIPTPVTGSETDNGLSSVKLRVNSQNVVQAAYAGDLKGRLWKFDLSSTAASGWKVAFNGTPLFTAPLGASQPITVQPLMLDHPLNGKIIYVGTGKFLETADKQTNAQQDFYAIWDADSGVGGITESNLQIQQISTSVVGSGATYYTSTANKVDWTSKKGWYMPLSTVAPFVGERIIFPAQTIRGRIAFTTAAVNSTDPCESTGTGRLFEVDAATGGMLTYRFLDTDGDGDITNNDTLVSGISFGAGIPSLASYVESSARAVTYVMDSSGKLSGLTEPLSGTGTAYQRIMWRQIQ